MYNINIDICRPDDWKWNCDADKLKKPYQNSKYFFSFSYVSLFIILIFVVPHPNVAGYLVRFSQRQSRSFWFQSHRNSSHFLRNTATLVATVVATLVVHSSTWVRNDHWIDLTAVVLAGCWDGWLGRIVRVDSRMWSIYGTERMMNDMMHVDYL